MTDSLEYRFAWTPELFAIGGALADRRHAPGGRRLAPPAAIAFGVLLALLFALMRVFAPEPGEIIAGAIGLASGSFAAIFALSYMAGRHRRSLLEAEIALRKSRGAQTIQAGPDGVESRCAGERHFIPWSAIHRVEEAPQGLVLFITELAWLPLPDAALPSGLKRREARSRIDAWRAP